MRANIDDQKGYIASNSITLIMKHGDGERHVKVTDEGVIIDLVRKGEVEATVSHGFDTLDPEET